MDKAARGEASPGGAAASAGALLRAAREQQGMHIATLAAAIKVAPRKLEALENDRWDELPGPTFTRALAQAVCRALHTDPRPVMDLLPPADTSMLDSSFGTINEPFSGRAGRDAGLPGWVPRGPWLIAAVLLLLGAAVVMWMPPGTWSRWFGAARPAGGEATASINLPPATTAVGVAPPAATGPQATSATSTNPAPAMATPSAATTTAQAVPATSASAAEAAPGAGAATGAPVPAGALVIACRARSWIEVIDARGRVLLSRNLEAGESIGLDGLLPMQLVVGNAEGTEVTYKGTAVDLASRARDNVARLELK